MKKLIFILLFVFFISFIWGNKISEEQAIMVAESFISNFKIVDRSIRDVTRMGENQENIAYIIHLAPLGFIAVSADDELPPVLAYSDNSVFSGGEDTFSAWEFLRTIITGYVSNRIISALENAIPSERVHQVDLRDDFEQWPPEGSSATGGWVKTRWNQTAPYNDLCPIDPVSHTRSLAGCPSVALAQIINYHQQLNGTSLTDMDDYYHNYSGRQYWVDNDCEANGFPSWNQLNSYLSGLSESYWLSEDPSSTEIAALVFACGAAARQVYSSQGSGTFAVNQALSAIQRFGYNSAVLLDSNNADLWERIAQNIKDAQPVLYACVTPAWDAGHNVVLDGYNTDEYFHINFGWGGSYDGWYLLPQEMPYQLSVVEGAVVDIIPPQNLFCIPEEICIETESELIQGIQFEILNVTQDTLTLQAIEIADLAGIDFSVAFDQSLPFILPSGQSAFGTVTGSGSTRSYLENQIRIKHDKGFQVYPVHINEMLTTEINSPEIPGMLRTIRAYPNPFVSGAVIESEPCLKAEQSFAVYNIRGQKIRQLVSTEEYQSTYWDGKDEQGRDVPRGIYLIGEAEGRGVQIRLLKL